MDEMNIFKNVKTLFNEEYKRFINVYWAYSYGRKNSNQREG